MSTALHAPSTTGRRGTGAPTPGRQRAQPHRHVAGRRAPADPQHPVVSCGTVHQLRLSVGAIVSAIHQTAQKAQCQRWQGPILDRVRASPVVHADETGPTKPAGVRAGPTAACGLSVLPPNGIFCGGAGARRWWMKPERCFLRSAGQRLLRSPTTIMMAPNNAAGPTCCGTSMTCAPSTPMLRHWPGGPTPSTGC